MSKESNKAEMRPQTIKPAKTVQVKVILPWVIIIVLVALAVGIWQGWTMRSSQVTEVRSQVAYELQVAAEAKKAQK